jgi:hypothetical protein
MIFFTLIFIIFQQIEHRQSVQQQHETRQKKKRKGIIDIKSVCGCLY